MLPNGEEKEVDRTEMTELTTQGCHDLVASKGLKKYADEEEESGE
eukprot:CAMPEP_0178443690 /NCGR_PEP_ID=MMETSP0689_2-20121128/39049_1 /TAXON_ID=160604 /ORGANISM="Amphidinium massartii, Strain CS-259" /LENGTH=44 /DNA_ID= /DNA_START= /DNA_END= /DNA_ORIENTATION=